MVSTMPSRMTTISNCSFMSERCDRSKNGLLVLISWQMVRGDTKKSWSAPVPNPTSSSHWSRGRNSPSGVCRDWKHKQSGPLRLHFYLWVIIQDNCSTFFSKNDNCPQHSLAPDHIIVKFNNKNKKKDQNQNLTGWALAAWILWILDI